jgi:hypothetical protein
MDMSEQFLLATLEHSSSRSGSTWDAANNTILDNPLQTNFDLDNYPVMSSCTISPSATHSNQNMHNSNYHDLMVMMG